MIRVLALCVFVAVVAQCKPHMVGESSVGGCQYSFNIAPKHHLNAERCESVFPKFIIVPASNANEELFFPRENLNYLLSCDPFETGEQRLIWRDKSTSLVGSFRQFVLYGLRRAPNGEKLWPSCRVCKSGWSFAKVLQAHRNIDAHHLATLINSRFAMMTVISHVSTVGEKHSLSGFRCRFSLIDHISCRVGARLV